MDFSAIGLAAYLFADGGNGNSSGPFITMIVLTVVIAYFVFVLPSKKQQTSRKQMLASLKKNDHVVTYGGIHGFVVSVKPESDVVTLKLDESSNVRVDFDLNAVARVVKDKEESAGEKKTSS